MLHLMIISNGAFGGRVNHITMNPFINDKTISSPFYPDSLKLQQQFGIYPLLRNQVEESIRVDRSQGIDAADETKSKGS